METRNGKRVVVVGAGGNIGSHLVPHLGRMGAIGELVLIDRDTYEESNLVGQAIGPADLGKPKATVQKERLTGLFPAGSVRAVVGEVERLPLGRLRADLLLTCVDSLRTRQWINETARLLGVAWIDAGVEATGELARVTTLAPSENCACLECSWSERDYERLEQTYPCGAGSSVTTGSFPTGASSALGALAASVQALEVARWLEGGEAVGSRQVVIDARHYRCLPSRLVRNPECRLASHRRAEIHPFPVETGEATLGEVLELAARIHGVTEPGLRVPGQRFAHALTCPRCGARSACLYLASRIVPGRSHCRRCGEPRIVAGSDRAEWLETTSLPGRALTRTLESLGLRDHEVLVLGDLGLEHWLEITGGVNSGDHA